MPGRVHAHMYKRIAVLLAAMGAVAAIGAPAASADKPDLPCIYTTDVIICFD